MAGHEWLHLPLKMKRKDIDQVNEDFSDLSLSSPARKIRRLDLDFPPLMEKGEAGMGMAKPVAEELNPEPVNEERTIVVFKPLQYQQSYCGNLHVETDLICGFKNKFLRAGYYSNARQGYDDNDINHSSNNCRAVVPWSPSQFPLTRSSGQFQRPHRAPEIIELDETGEDAMMEEATMEIEEGSNIGTSLPQEAQFTHGLGATSRENEGLRNWQQQSHCVIPLPPQTNSAPISWSR